MAPPADESAAVLPAPFLRGLEGDLRALCADAKRHNPSLKDVSERVILQLKEADTPAASAEAASAASEAFCAAAAPAESGASASSAAAHNRVVLRAVSCLHKLLTHRAVAASRLPAVVDALEKLAVDPASDDAVTLKVLQALLSMLTVRMYICALPEEQLSRAFSMLFKLRTRSASAAVGVASGPLSAISAVAVSKAEPDEFGVIEVTAQAAFRQGASDLFAAASAAVEEDSTVHQAVDSLPPIAAAAYALFQDMCAVIAGDEVCWLDLGDRRVQPVLALEVMDDGLGGNVPLFRAEARPLFSGLLSSRLCPAIHEMLRSDADRQVYKALFAVAVTVITRLWADLGPDSEVLLCCIVKLVEEDGGPEAPSWASVYALEALRAIFHESIADSSTVGEDCEHVPIFVSLFKMFDIQSASTGGGGQVMAGMLKAVCESALALVRSGKADIGALPIASVAGSFKHFSTSGANRVNLFVASAVGLCLSYCNAAKFVSTSQSTATVAVVLVNHDSAKLVTEFLSSLLLRAPSVVPPRSRSTSASATEAPLLLLISGLTKLLSAADAIQVDDAREAVISSLASRAAAALGDLPANKVRMSNREEPMSNLASQAAAALGEIPTNKSAEYKLDATRVVALYRGLFDAEKNCGERFGTAWREFVDAAHALDVALHGETSVVSDSEHSSASSLRSPTATALAPLKLGLEEAFTHASKLSWAACNDLVSALVVSSRSSLAAIAKAPGPEDAGGSTATSEFRVFGIARAETVMTGIFSPESKPGTELMPHGLWELLTGHLVAVASDSTTKGVRTTAIRSLIRVSACALESNFSHLLPQDSVIAPISDLLSSAFLDTRESCLDAVYSLLETRGEFIKDSQAWDSILSILRSACGGVVDDKPGDSSASTPVQVSNGAGSRKSSSGDAARGAPSSTGADAERAGEAMVQRGFRVVQLIADDFLPFLAFETLSNWTAVLRRYGQQGEDVNVALTAVGLIWRTADHFAKHCGERVYDTLWMELFEVLKAIGSDGRPEVRNGAVKTLTGTLTAHGSKLTASAWRGCVERALLPLLEEVMQGGGTDGRESLQAKNKADSQLVMHHSRDTPRKQWNETRVLALSGVASVLRKAIPDMADLQDDSGSPLLMMLADGGSAGLWAKMLRAAGSAASSTDNEVALGGVAALHDLLSASGSVKADAMESSGAAALWDAVWVAIDEAVAGGEVSGGEAVAISNDKALVMLAKGLGTAREELADAFTVKSSVLFLTILGRLVLGESATRSDANNLSLSPGEKRAMATVTEVQRTAVDVIENLSFGQDTTTWTALVSQLLFMIQGRPLGGSDALLYRLIRLVESLYIGDRLPAEVKATQLHEVIETLGVVMCRNPRGVGVGIHSISNISVGSSALHASEADGASSTEVQDGGVMTSGEALLDDGQPLWIIAVRTFSVVLQHGLDAGLPTARLWTTLREVSFQFLYSPLRATQEALMDPRALEERALAELNDIKVAQCVREALVFMTGSVDKNAQKELFDVLAQGAEEGMRGCRPKFVRACQSFMFSLAEVSAKVEVNIAEQAAACVVRVSDSVLGRFVADGQRAGKCPLPSERRAEVVFLLRRLQALRLSNSDNDERRHLRTLHSRLCDCSDGSDEAVRLLAQITMQSAA